MANNNGNTYLYGLVAEFDNAEALLEAAKQARSAGYEDVRAFTPYYVEGLGEVLGSKANHMPWVVLGGLLLGAVLGFFLQYYTEVIDYPINIAGRPMNSWQSFLVITFELGILFAGLGVFITILVQNNFPLPYHPIFNAPNIELASRSNFFLCVKTTDRRFQLQKTREFLQSLQPMKVSEVPC